MQEYNSWIDNNGLQGLPATLYGNAVNFAIGYSADKVEMETSDFIGFIIAHAILKWAVYICFLMQGIML